ARRERGFAGPARLGIRDRVAAGRLPCGARAARYRRLHARGDRSAAGNHRGNIEGTAVQGETRGARATRPTDRGEDLMRNDDRSFDENEWTPEERARIAALSTHRVPPADLKERTTRALRDQGHIGRPRVSTWIIVGGLIAATLVFGAGALVGYVAA